MCMHWPHQHFLAQRGALRPSRNITLARVFMRLSGHHAEIRFITVSTALFRVRSTTVWGWVLISRRYGVNSSRISSPDFIVFPELLVTIPELEGESTLILICQHSNANIPVHWYQGSVQIIEDTTCDCTTGFTELGISLNFTDLQPRNTGTYSCRTDGASFDVCYFEVQLAGMLLYKDWDYSYTQQNTSEMLFSPGGIFLWRRSRASIIISYFM